MTDSPGTFEQFLFWERASRDTLEVKRLYIDMAGDLAAGVVLSQIVYWHLPSRDGHSRLQVRREGKLWLAKGRADWWDECRISPKQADRALHVLEERGLVEVRLFQFRNAPTKHVRILPEGFLRAWRAELARSSGSAETEDVSLPDLSGRGKSISTKRRNPTPPKGKMHLPRKAKSLDTETTTETTAAAGPASHSGPAGAAAALVEELVARGVGRAAAARFAREKPDACRRQLAYLPYAEFRSTEGAWLANAIRDEYGPPRGYTEEQARLERERQAEEERLAGKARQKHALAIREEETSRLRAAYRQLEKTGGEAFQAFCEYVERERARTGRIAVSLSARRREELLAAFDRPERRLELFEAWTSAGSRFPVPQTAAPAPEETHPPGGP